MVLLVKLCEPLFSYQTTLPPLNAVAKMSRSPSPSISLIAKPSAPLRLPSSIGISVKFSDPSFSYQLISFASIPVATISISPSLSISATNTSLGPSAEVAIVVAAKVGSAAPLFLSQVILSS